MKKRIPYLQKKRLLLVRSRVGLLLFLFLWVTASAPYVLNSNDQMIQWLINGNLEEEADHQETKTNSIDKEKFKKLFDLNLKRSMAMQCRPSTLIRTGLNGYKAPIVDILTPPPESFV
ncbi:MAG: hypothetical protein NWR67_07970 [Saprospiraceae bacterium]|jgi:hypothetical protein|nr:hypothetical protein [Saprospiraceae bacterium]MDP4820928.1 hypothetical protein [Saprospiraceae bacterium]MDP4998341.1 hypothetical protein [Saprospiraceae bacterium]